MVHVIDDLTSGPSYTALSYAWGAVHPQVEIYLNGESHFVRHNLWLALQRLGDPPIQAIAESTSRCYSKNPRDPVPQDRPPVELGISHQERYFFVDAICINQDDALEKPSQVNLMGTIYSQAMLVICWIGEASGNSDSIVQHLNFKTPEERISYPEFGRVHREPEWKAGDCSSFLDREYWTRLWVVQEILLAKVAIILCGNAICSWHNYCQNWDRLSHRGAREYNNRIFASKIRDILKYGGVFNNLTDLISVFKWQECTLRQDKIFALLGLIPQEVERYGSLLSADYGKPLREIFMGVFVCTKSSLSYYGDSGHTKRCMLENLARAREVEPLSSQNWKGRSGLFESWKTMELCYFGKELPSDLELQ